jgi:hypothetical protein
VTDYWLNKLFFDLQQQPEKAARFKSDLKAVLADYPLKPNLREAVINDDLAALATHANAYLLRFYYAIRGVKDADFIRQLNELPASEGTTNG